MDFDNDLAAIFVQYRDVLKPLIAEMESYDQRFPTNVLNEIRASFDHIARCYYEKTSTTIENIDRTRGHISRAIMDSYKTMIVIFHDQVKKFQRKNYLKDWSTVDGGRFHSQFYDLLCQAEDACIKAKRQTDTEQNWLEAYSCARNLSRFLKMPQNVLRVAEGKNVTTWRTHLFWSLISAALGALLGWMVALAGT